MTVHTKTKHRPLTVKQILIVLRTKKLRLYAYKSEGRFICRIKDQNLNIVSITSRSTLDDAITVAVANVKRSQRGVTV